MNLDELNKLDGMHEVEETIQSKFQSDAKLLYDIPEYLFSVGGKRIRPILALLGCSACGGKKSEELIQVAAGIELIHMATLLHDDIIDNSPLRRSKTSAHKKFGHSNTLLAGDFLLVRAFGLCGLLDDVIVDETERACVELTEGEILETPLYQERHDLDSCINIAKKKTAALFRLAAFCGSYLASAPEETYKNYAKFGESLGIAFQILDDVLDVTSTEQELGKAIGTDIREKKPSIVNVLWLNNKDSKLSQILVDQNSEITTDLINQSISEINELEIIQQAKDLGRRYIDQAEKSLFEAQQAVEVDNASYNMLKTLIKFTISRSK